MSNDKIEEIRARHEEGIRAGADDDRAALLAEVERQARHVEELREKIGAERSCACSFDAPGDVCAAHSPALTRTLAEVERLRDVLKIVRINGPDSNGLVWLSFSREGEVCVSIEVGWKTISQALLEFEQIRRNALEPQP